MVPILNEDHPTLFRTHKEELTRLDLNTLVFLRCDIFPIMLTGLCPKLVQLDIEMDCLSFSVLCLTDNLVNIFITFCTLWCDWQCAKGDIFPSMFMRQGLVECVSWDKFIFNRS